MEILNLTQKLDWHPTRRWRTRELTKINKVIIHQELGEGSIENVNRYHIKPNHMSLKGCPRICYHYGIRENGEVVQMNELSHIVWHTKGQNTNAIGIMLVGNFAGPGHNTGTRDPSKAQMDSLEELVGYLLKSFNFTHQDLYGHYHFGKPACPGYIVQDWIENLRNNIVLDELHLVQVEKSIVEIQKRLNHLGYGAGKADGIQGVNTLTAIRKFQKEQQLMVDGIVGPQTWKRLLTLTA